MHEVVIFDIWLSIVLYLVCDVLLLCRGMTFRVNKSGMSNQVASVLHYEAPRMGTQKHMYRLQTHWLLKVH